jgi:glucose/arabinose dehydrogenase
MPPALKLTEVITGLNRPVYVTQAPGDNTRMFIVEQGGTIRIWNGTALAATPFLTVTGISSGGERGLLGLAFHPMYATNGLFYIHYNNTAGDSVIAEYTRATADTSMPTATRMVHMVDQPASRTNHKGGNLQFGPDGLLYAGFGDGGGQDDPDANSQDDAVDLGKMLRINVNMTPAMVTRWDKGLRNPWRYSFDSLTGDLYIGDVGQNAIEEITVHPASVTTALNHGWDVREGNMCHEPANNCTMTGLTAPVDEYPRNMGTSVTGGYVYRGAKIPCLAGWYIYGDYNTRRTWAFKLVNGVAQNKTEISMDLMSTSTTLIPGTNPGPGGISSFGVDNAKELYLVSYGGRIYRIDPE